MGYLWRLSGKESYWMWMAAWMKKLTATLSPKFQIIRWSYCLDAFLMQQIVTLHHKLQYFRNSYMDSARTIYEICWHSQQKTVFSCSQVAATLHSPRVKNHERLKRNLSFWCACHLVHNTSKNNKLRPLSRKNAKKCNDHDIPKCPTLSKNTISALIGNAIFL